MSTLDLLKGKKGMTPAPKAESKKPDLKVVEPTAKVEVKKPDLEEELGEAPVSAKTNDHADDMQHAGEDAEPQVASNGLPTAAVIGKMKKEELDALYAQVSVKFGLTYSGWPKLSVDNKRAKLTVVCAPESTVGDGTAVGFKLVPLETPAESSESEAPKAKGKGKAKGTAVAEAGKEGIVLDGNDPIATSANHFENLKDETSAVKELRAALEAEKFNLFHTGGLLAIIHQNNWFGEYESFKAFLEGEFAMSYRKAMYLIAIYVGLVEANIPWAKVKDLGWTKVVPLIPVLTPDNVDEWVKIGLSTPQRAWEKLIEEAQKKQAGTPAAPGEQSEAETKGLTFKLHKDQKETVDAAIEKAMKATGSDVKTVALEAICMDYLAASGKKGASTAQKGHTNAKSLFEAIKKDKGEDAAAKDILGAFQEVFPGVLDIELTEG